MSEPHKPLSTPGLWPGLVALVYFALLIGLATFAAKEFFGNDVKSVGNDVKSVALVHTGAASLLTIVVWLVVGRRHKERAGADGDGPFFRIRDLAVLTLAGTMAPLVGSSIALSKLTSAAAGAGSGETTVVLSLVVAVLGLFLTSKVWGALSGDRSVVWGGLSVLGGVVAVLSSLKMLTLDMMGQMNAGVYLVFGAQMIMGAAYAVGGVALFKPRVERTAAAMTVCALLGTTWMLFAAGDLYLLFTVLTGDKSDSAVMMGAPIVHSTLLFLLATIAAWRHRGAIAAGNASSPTSPTGA